MPLCPPPPPRGSTPVGPSCRLGGGGAGRLAQPGSRHPGAARSPTPKKGRAGGTCAPRGQTDRRRPQAPAGHRGKCRGGWSCGALLFPVVRGRALMGALMGTWGVGLWEMRGPGARGCGVRGAWEGALAGTRFPPPGERRIGPTWGRIGRRRTRRSGWCGRRRAPLAAPPCTSPPGCALRRGTACGAAAARMRSPGRSFFALSRNTTLFSLRAEKKKACSRVGVRAPGRVRPLPAAPGTAAAEGQAGTQLAGPLPTPGPAPIAALGAVLTARDRRGHFGGQRTPSAPQGRSVLGGGLRPTNRPAFSDFRQLTPGGPARGAGGPSPPETRRPLGNELRGGENPGPRAGRRHRRGKGLGWGRRWGAGEGAAGEGDVGVGSELSGCPLAPGWVMTLHLGGAPCKRGQAHVDCRPAGPQQQVGTLQPVPNRPLSPAHLGEQFSDQPPPVLWEPPLPGPHGLPWVPGPHNVPETLISSSPHTCACPCLR